MQVDVSVTRSRGLVIPEWTASVPVVSVSRKDERFVTLTGALIRLGAPSARAEEIAIEGIQEVFNGGWISKLKMFTARNAHDYIQAYGDLGGFDPERLEHAYVPGAFSVGYHRNPMIREAFKEMRHAPTT